MRYSWQGGVSSHYGPEQYFTGTEGQQCLRREPVGLKHIIVLPQFSKNN